MFVPMTRIQKTMTVPADRRLRFDVPLPESVSAGQVDITIIVQDDASPLPDAEAGAECPICKAQGYKFNAETVAAFEEGDAILRGEIPGKRFDSFEEFLADLKGG
jgi:hypothetical protein